MNQSRGGTVLGVLGLLIALAALCVAILNYLAPFSPIGPSPLAPDNAEPTSAPYIFPTAVGSSNVLIPSAEPPVASMVEPSPAATAEPSPAPTDESAATTLPQAGDIRTVMRGGIAVEQVFVPAGSFMMGSEDGRDNEQPVHEVTLDAFWIDRTEVTNAQFAAFIADTGYVTTAERAGGSYFIDPETAGTSYLLGMNWRFPQGPGSELSSYDTYPVVHISWDDATTYASWASGRLPTEAEWEYAARGPESRVYPWGNEFKGENLNYCDRNCSSDFGDRSIDDGYRFTAPVGSYPEGVAWVGALDMAGNVSEWVSDWYHRDYYQNSPIINPLGPLSGDSRIRRGGSWVFFERPTLVTYRNFTFPSFSYNDLGFRVVEPLSDPDS